MPRGRRAGCAAAAVGAPLGAVPRGGTEAPRGGNLDVLMFYLDDGWICGDDQPVARAFAALQNRGPSVGGDISLKKSELIPTSTHFDRSLFPPELTIVERGDFGLLGAPVGSAAHCDAHTRARIARAQPLLDEVALLEDPQIALTLLRACSSFGKMVYSARVTEYGTHADALADWDGRVRKCFEGFSGLHPNDTQWQRAGWAVRNGGLGLRSVARHAAAAWVASRSATLPLCTTIDAAHVWDGDRPGSATHAAVQHLNAVFPHADRLAPSEPSPLRQQQLSDRLVGVEFNRMVDPAAGLDERTRALLRLQRQPHAGAWLLAMPSHATGNVIAPELFLILLRRRLGLPISESTSWCPLCAGVMDPWGDHALVCSGGGDRTMRHNALRDLLLRFARSAGYTAVAEKQGLLPGDQERRPADVWLSAWSGGLPAAVDLAITSGLQCGLLGLSSADGSAAVDRYEDRKRNFLHTAQQFADASLTFVPFVVEAEGGLGTSARGVLAAIAGAVGRLTGEGTGVRGELAAQALSIALQRANATAIARRAPGAMLPLAAPLAAAQAQLRFAAAAAPTQPHLLAQPHPPVAHPLGIPLGAVPRGGYNVGAAAAPAAAAAACVPVRSSSPSPPRPSLAPAPLPPPLLAAGAYLSSLCSPPALCTTPVSDAVPAAAPPATPPPQPVGGASSAPPPNDTSHLSSV